MSSDSEDILKAVEKAFDINIPDQEAESILTVGDFHNSVWNHLAPKHSKKCKSQALFYKLRLSAIELLPFNKNEFNLDASLNTLFAARDRRSNYFALQRSSDLIFPKLVLPRKWSQLLSIAGIVLVLGTLVVTLIMINFFGYSKWTIVYSILGSIVTYLISKAMNSKRTIIKPDRVRDFTYKVLALNYSQLPDTNVANRTEIELVINHIVADTAGFELEKIRPDKKIYAELGID